MKAHLALTNPLALLKKCPIFCGPLFYKQVSTAYPAKALTYTPARKIYDILGAMDITTQKKEALCLQIIKNSKSKIGPADAEISGKRTKA